MDRILTKIEDLMMWGAFLGALGIGVAQVILRYVFNAGFVWMESIFVTLTILSAMVGGSRAAANGVHVRIALLTDALPGGARLVVDLLALLATIAYSAVLAYAGYLYVDFLKMTGIVSVESGMPSWIIFTIVPFTMALFILRYLQQLPAVLRGRETTHVEYTD